MKNKTIPINLIIKELRMSARMTQKELAQKVGLTQQAIALIENGRRRIDVDLFIDILHVFDDVTLLESIKSYINASNDNWIELENFNVLMEFFRFLNGKAEREANGISYLFDQLNNRGKAKAIEQLELLTKIPEYQKDSKE